MAIHRAFAALESSKDYGKEWGRPLPPASAAFREQQYVETLARVSMYAVPSEERELPAWFKEQFQHLMKANEFSTNEFTRELETASEEILLWNSGQLSGHQLHLRLQERQRKDGW